VAVATVPNPLFPAQPVETPNDVLIERFVTYLTVEKGRGPHTINAYRCDLIQLSRFFGGRELITAKCQDLRDYTGQLLSTVGARSAARKVSCFRRFFKFLFMDGLIVADPMLRVESPKFGKALPKLLALPEIDAVLDQNNANAEEYLTRRNQAILELLYAGGLRASEITGARLVDLNLADRYLMVCGKGNKERIAPFGRTAARALNHYLVQRPLLTKDSPWLFVGRWGKQLTRQRLWQIVHARSEGIGRNVSPHMLRHSCATHIMENGAGFRTIQTILGHSDISTTELYTHVTLGWLQKIYRRHNPRSRSNGAQLQLQLELASLKTEALGPALCAHCMTPVCAKSKWYCETHLLLNREASKRCRDKKKPAVGSPRKKAA
jgi:integrase/recombinase XerD